VDEVVKVIPLPPLYPCSLLSILPGFHSFPIILHSHIISHNRQDERGCLWIYTKSMAWLLISRRRLPCPLLHPLLDHALHTSVHLLRKRMENQMLFHFLKCFDSIVTTSCFPPCYQRVLPSLPSPLPSSLSTVLFPSDVIPYFGNQCVIFDYYHHSP